MTDFSGAMQATTSVVITPTTNMGNKGIRMLLEDTVNHCETLLTYFITGVNNPLGNLIINRFQHKYLCGRHRAINNQFGKYHPYLDAGQSGYKRKQYYCYANDQYSHLYSHHIRRGGLLLVGH